MEILKTIALLCQVNGYAAKEVIEIQLTCQQYYVKCLDPLNANYKTLAVCIKEKK